MGRTTPLTTFQRKIDCPLSGAVTVKMTSSLSGRHTMSVIGLLTHAFATHLTDWLAFRSGSIAKLNTWHHDRPFCLPAQVRMAMRPLSRSSASCEAFLNSGERSEDVS